MADFATLKQFLADQTTKVVPSQPQVQNDVAQDIAKMLFTAAESEAGNIAADQGGTGFNGDAIKHEADKILQRVKMFLDDLIKQG